METSVSFFSLECLNPEFFPPKLFLVDPSSEVCVSLDLNFYFDDTLACFMLPDKAIPFFVVVNGGSTKGFETAAAQRRQGG